MEDLEILEEMHNKHDYVLTKLGKIVHPSFVKEFAKILHYSWLEDLPEAKSIADKLNFNPIDFVALALNKEEFKELFLLELEENYMEYYG